MAWLFLTKKKLIYICSSCLVEMEVDGVLGRGVKGTNKSLPGKARKWTVPKKAHAGTVLRASGPTQEQSVLHLWGKLYNHSSSVSLCKAHAQSAPSTPKGHGCIPPQNSHKMVPWKHMSLFWADNGLALEDHRRIWKIQLTLCDVYMILQIIL